MESNNKKKIIITAIVIASLLICVGVFLSLNDKNNKKQQKEETKKEEKCSQITGGGYNLILNTNGGNKIDNISVCIACPPNSYKDIPTPTKENDKFLGWYLDSEFTKPLNVTNTKDIKPEQKLDKNGCLIGYNDITIYAKWEKDSSKEQKEDDKKKQEPSKECMQLVGGGYNIIFVTNGGKKVNNILICPSCNPNGYGEIPTTTKKDYKFLGWYLDSNFTKKVNVTNTKDLTPEQKYDEKGCPNGYKDITLYAKFDTVKNTSCRLPIGGGGFSITFNTNGGNEIKKISVCPTCGPEDIEDIPTPTKANSKFLGWYYDSKFTNKVTATKSTDVKSENKYDENGCQSGIEDVTLYAKWG